uniref:Uncharacterized protein n=1 Tax=Mycena chlorophos TaxID=658473 RepID=A0ABQ0L780_MYCCL|nr:predicted protein [Mycena chlorophos]
MYHAIADYLLRLLLLGPAEVVSSHITSSGDSDGGASSLGDGDEDEEMPALIEAAETGGLEEPDAACG